MQPQLLTIATSLQSNIIFNSKSFLILSMADDHFAHHTTAGNWWDSSSRTRYESGAASSSSSSAINMAGSFGGWPDIKSSSSMDSSGRGGLVDPNLHSMGLGLSSHSHSHSMDWNNQAALLRSGGEQMNRGFSMDQPYHDQLSAHGSSMDSSTSFRTDPSTLLQGLLGSDQQQYHQTQTNYHYHHDATNSLGMNMANELFAAPKPSHSPLHFSNNAPFWNASSSTSAAAMNPLRPSFFPSLHAQPPSPTFVDHKPTKVSVTQVPVETGKKSGNSSIEAASKRPRNETPLPPFKVRKEKMGDRITALQQLVSPFGKTDTASVLSEAIEYIKFLHQQITVLSTPYMKSGAPMQHQQGIDNSEEGEEAKQELRSRGLCLVQVSSTFPVTHETTVDFWNPTFGGTYR